MTIRKVQQSDENALEEYLKTNYSSTPFHTTQWMSVVEDEYGHSNESLIAESDGKIVGYLPLSLINIPFSNGLLASGVFTSHCEVLANQSTIQTSLLQSAMKVSEIKNVNYLELKNKNKSQVDNLIGKNGYVTMVYDCRKNIDEAWASFPSYVRKQIRKSKKNNLSCEISKDDLDDFYNLLSLTMKRHGTPVHSKTFYKRILDEFDESSLVKIIFNGDVISAYLIIGYHGKMYSLAGASHNDYWNLRPNELVTWETISYSIENNYDFIDLGRSMIDSGTYQFKKKMGADSEPLNYYYYLVNSNSVPQIDQSNSKLKLATYIWKKIPIDLTKKYGHYLIRYVA